MEVSISNENLIVKANTHGGEIHSIQGKKSGQEYLWKGIPFWWKIYCPTLFPVIGKVKNLHYKYNNKEYFMPQHGFAANAKHILKNKTANEMEFVLKSDEETKSIYPFEFALSTKYKLEGSRIIITFEVKNNDDKDIYFSIGAHPALKCPMYGEEDSLDDYYIEFEHKETVSKKEITKDDFLTGRKIEFLEDSNTLNISLDIFKDGTMILENLKSNYVVLKSRKHNRSIKINFEQFDILSIWALDRNTEFVCIEPWMGHADYDDFNGEISEKEGIIRLEKGGEYTISYSIEINEYES